MYPGPNLLIRRAPTCLTAPRKVPHLESGRGGCRGERGTEGTRVSTLSWAETLGPFLKQAPPYRFPC